MHAGCTEGARTVEDGACMSAPPITRPIAIVVIAATILGVILVQAAGPGERLPASAAASAAAAPDISGADPELTSAIEAAMDRFDTAGLALPALRIHVHPTTDGCEGHVGLFSEDDAGSRIDLCTTVTGMILHELAHAWEHHAVSDATRQAFLDKTGLEAWSRSDVDWEERGIEAAAQVIAWGLMDIPITNPGAFSDQLAQFELLTGTPTPRLAGTNA